MNISKFQGWARQAQTAGVGSAIMLALAAAGALVVFLAGDDAGDNQLRLIAAIVYTAGLFTGIVLAIWAYISFTALNYTGSKIAAQLNPEAYKGKRLGWVVWSAFIPVVALFAPYVYAKAIIQVAKPEGERHLARQLAIYWWIWAASTAAGNAIEAVASQYSSDTLSIALYGALALIVAGGLLALARFAGGLNRAVSDKVKDFAETSENPTIVIEKNNKSKSVIVLTLLLVVSLASTLAVVNFLGAFQSSSEYELSEQQISEGYSAYPGLPIAYRYVETPTCNEFAFCTNLELISSADCVGATVDYDYTDASGVSLGTDQALAGDLTGSSSVAVELGSNEEISNVNLISISCSNLGQ